MFLSKTQKTTLQCFFWGNTKSRLKENARAFSQVDTTQENVKFLQSTWKTEYANSNNNWITYWWQ